MSSDTKELMAVLRVQFFQDGEDVLNALEQNLSTFMEDPASAIQAVLRATHNLKGSAQLSGFSDFSKLMHDLETSVQTLAYREINVDNLQTCFLYLKRLLALSVNFFADLMSDRGRDAKSSDIWKASLEAVETIANHSPLAQSSPVVAPSANPQLADLDNWDMPTSNTNLDSVAPSKSAAEVDKGWGIFEDVPPTAPVASTLIKEGSLSIEAAPKNSSEATRLASVEHVNKLLNRKRDQDNTPTREEYLLCLNEGSSFAVPVKYIQEILPNREDRPLPVRKKEISGVISFRGKVMAIVTLFDKKERRDLYAPTRCIVVCQIGKKQFGFRVDQVLSVFGVDQSSLQALPGGVDDTSVVRNLAQVDGKTVSFVDPSLVISA